MKINAISRIAITWLSSPAVTECATKAMVVKRGCAKHTEVKDHMPEVDTCQILTSASNAKQKHIDILAPGESFQIL